MIPSIGSSSLESKWVRFSNAESRTKNTADSSTLFLPDHAADVIAEWRCSHQGRWTIRNGNFVEAELDKRPPNAVVSSSRSDSAHAILKRLGMAAYAKSAITSVTNLPIGIASITVIPPPLIGELETVVHSCSAIGQPTAIGLRRYGCGQYRSTLSFCPDAKSHTRETC